jgi:hypothetical protein
MAYTSHALSPSEASLVSEKTVRRKGFLTRLFVAVQQSRMRQAEKEIALYLHLSGGITDSAEREIERRFLTNRSSF